MAQIKKSLDLDNKQKRIEELEADMEAPVDLSALCGGADAVGCGKNTWYIAGASIKKREKTACKIAGDVLR